MQFTAKFLLSLRSRAMIYSLIFLCVFFLWNCYLRSQVTGNDTDVVIHVEESRFRLHKVLSCSKYIHYSPLFFFFFVFPWGKRIRRSFVRNLWSFFFFGSSFVSSIIFLYFTCDWYVLLVYMCSCKL